VQSAADFEAIRIQHFESSVKLQQL
jgi:hypothetical protein